VLDTTLAHLCTLLSSSASFWVVATRQNSSSGKPKSPRIQVVLPEELCLRLTALAEDESRTVSNMAKVLIQQGVQRYEQGGDRQVAPRADAHQSSTEQLRNALESKQTGRLRGAPRRVRLHRPN
jgi:predicted DNA-binding protein